ncbi:MAG TPA: YcxB family protein [Micromonospora sp.]
MPAEHVAAAPVELHYTPTLEDMADAVAAQQGPIGRSWRVPVLSVAALAALLHAAVTFDLRATSPAAIALYAVELLLPPLLTVGLCLLLFRLLGRWQYRWQARLVLRGNPWMSQPMRTIVTDQGIRLNNATGTSTHAWSQYPLYVETERSFVLLASKGLGAMFFVLPKRGLVNADPAPLRALLAAHSRQRD